MCEKYIYVALERLNAIQPELFSDTFTFEESKKKDEPRIPFGALIENGLLDVGETLYFDNKEEFTAITLANGHIRHKEIEGSIHKVGGAIKNAPCNGWDHWYYVDKNTKQRVVINELRKQIRQEMSRKTEPQIE